MRGMPEQHANLSPASVAQYFELSHGWRNASNDGLPTSYRKRKRANREHGLGMVKIETVWESRSWKVIDNVSLNLYTVLNVTTVMSRNTRQINKKVYFMTFKRVVTENA